MAYVLQENGFDTVEANESLGFDNDLRNYDDAIAVLKTLRLKPVTLITNNPNKLEALKTQEWSLPVEPHYGAMFRNTTKSIWKRKLKNLGI